MDDIQIQGYGSSAGRQAYDRLHASGWQDWDIRNGYKTEPVDPVVTYTEEDIGSREGTVVYNVDTGQFDEPVEYVYVDSNEAEGVAWLTRRAQQDGWDSLTDVEKDYLIVRGYGYLADGGQPYNPRTSEPYVESVVIGREGYPDTKDTGNVTGAGAAVS